MPHSGNINCVTNSASNIMNVLYMHRATSQDKTNSSNCVC